METKEGGGGSTAGFYVAGNQGLTSFSSSISGTSEHALLAIHLVRDFLGKECVEVFSVLVNRGALSWAKLKHCTMLDVPTLQQAVLVLMRFRFISIVDQFSNWLDLVPEGLKDLDKKAKKKVKNLRPFKRGPVEFEANVEVVLCLLRRSGYEEVISERFGEVATAALYALFSRGSLSVYQLYLHTCAYLAGTTVSEEFDVSTLDQETCDSAMLAVRQLIVHQFLERVPSLQLTPAQRSLHDHILSRNGSESSIPVAKLVVTPRSAPGEKRKASTGMHAEKNRADSAKRARMTSTGTPEKEEEMEMDLPHPFCVPSTLVWLNHQRFTIALLQVECERVAEEKDSVQGRIVIRTMFSMVSGDLLKNPHASRRVMGDDLYDLVKPYRGEEIADKATFRSLLELMTKESCHLLEGSWQSGYILPFGKLCQVLAQKHVEAVIAGRYRVPEVEHSEVFAHRMWRVLKSKGQMDEKQLHDASMVPIKLARILLYRMFRDGLVKVQEVPKSKERSRARQNLYFWSVDLQASRLRLASECALALRNTLVVRRAYMRGVCPHAQQEEDKFQWADSVVHAEISAKPSKTEAKKQLIHALCEKDLVVSQCILRLVRAHLHLTSYIPFSSW